MRTFVIVGIILIAISLLVAKFAIDNRNQGTTHGHEAEAKQLAPQTVVCWGFFEVRGGIAQLDAKQAGEVTFVAEENVPVKAGALLLQVDDNIGQKKVKQAQIAVEAAKLQVAEAEKLTRLYELQKEMQALAIKRVEGEIRELKLKESKDIDLSTLDKNDPKLKVARDLYKEAYLALDLKKKAEDGKLEQIKLQDAKLKIDQAKADLRAKELQAEEAAEMLKYFQIVAPSDGSILRANVHKGEIIAPNPMRHAIEFLPKSDIIVRAEVLQEWGGLVKEKQSVDIEDDTYKGPTWKGEVESISKWYAPTRSPVIEPFRYNDVRTLEIVIRVTGADNVKIGQRVRAKVDVK